VFCFFVFLGYFSKKTRPSYSSAKMKFLIDFFCTDKCVRFCSFW
jgi:hypothetical protein